MTETDLYGLIAIIVLVSFIVGWMVGANGKGRK